jgi:hypothetical protein
VTIMRAAPPTLDELRNAVCRAGVMLGYLNPRLLDMLRSAPSMLCSD